MTEYKLISSDGHLNEVEATWKLVQKKHGDRAPKIVWNPSEEEIGPYLQIRDWRTSIEHGNRENCANEYIGYVIGGLGAGGTYDSPMALPSLEATALGRKSGKADDFRKGFRFEDFPGGGLDPAARLKDQDRDGIEAEVLYASHLRHFYDLCVDDEPFFHDICESYNEWAMDFCSHDPKRLIALPALSVLNPEGAAADIRKYARRGAKGFMMASSVPNGEDYGDKKFDPIWQAAEECGTPLGMHASTGKFKLQTFGKKYTRNFIGNHIEMQITLGEMIYGGIFDRFPSLKIVSSEFDIGWVGYLVQRTEGFNPALGLKMQVSDYFRRNIYFTFQLDRSGILTTPHFGEDNFLWANDFPHGVTLWPDSQKIVDIQMKGMPAAAVKKIVRDNTIRLYNLSIQ